ncbi:hypothetical protein Pmi06nite_83090 [Planotetraspora mira]|uniref:Uncharacterized protein n=1 Tax=Planotetraspora mira TaxID=58121 RepID=A0A8J3XBB5_9ACTN|nr:hypothetical protein Pmi06nite_83090 [Planotetraspora mira]
MSLPDLTFNGAPSVAGLGGAGLGADVHALALAAEDAEDLDGVFPGAAEPARPCTCRQGFASSEALRDSDEESRHAGRWFGRPLERHGDWAGLSQGTTSIAHYGEPPLPRNRPCSG